MELSLVINRREMDFNGSRERNVPSWRERGVINARKLQ